MKKIFVIIFSILFLIILGCSFFIFKKSIWNKETEKTTREQMDIKKEAENNITNPEHEPDFFENQDEKTNTQENSDNTDVLISETLSLIHI